MAILIIEQNGNLEGANLAGRVLIGRKSNNHIVIPEPTVSRIHAWIDTANGRYCVTDTGSRTGTWVNEKLVTGKRPLNDGDQIRIGGARLTFRTSALPDGVIRREFSNQSPADQETQGILFDCACGAPLWVTLNYAGKTGRCRHCGRVVRVPSARTRAAQSAGVVPVGAGVGAGGAGDPAATAAARQNNGKMCGICQSAISLFEETTDCPSCGLRFHTDCWHENYGCSAYGCDQVNALKPPDERPVAADKHVNGSSKKVIPARPPKKAGPTASPFTPRATMATFRSNDQAASNAATIDELEIMPGRKESYPIEHWFLAASVFAALAGALLWGVPSLGVSIWVGNYLNRLRGKRKSTVVIAAGALSFVGVAAGVVVSYIWWIGWARR